MLSADGSLHRVSPFITTTRETALAAAALLNLGAHDTVVDLGCGTGAAINVMCAHVAGARALGLDNCAELIASARANALDMHVGDRVCFELVDFLVVDAVALCSRITKGTTLSDFSYFSLYICGLNCLSLRSAVLIFCVQCTCTYVSRNCASLA